MHLHREVGLDVYANLYSSMCGRGIDVKLLSACLKKSPRCIRQKLYGYTDFTIEEAFIIKYRFFPDLALSYLFLKDAGGEEILRSRHHNARCGRI